MITSYKLRTLKDAKGFQRLEIDSNSHGLNRNPNYLYLSYSKNLMYLASPSFQESMNCRHLLCLDAFKNSENRKPINHFSLLKEPVSLDQLSAWEKEYIKMPIEEIISLLKICNFLQIKGLLRLMIKAVALQIQGK